jgi:hypothetical protein
MDLTGIERDEVTSKDQALIDGAKGRIDTLRSQMAAATEKAERMETQGQAKVPQFEKVWAPVVGFLKELGEACLEKDQKIDVDFSAEGTGVRMDIVVIGPRGEREAPGFVKQKVRGSKERLASLSFLNPGNMGNAGDGGFGHGIYGMPHMNEDRFALYFTGDEPEHGLPGHLCVHPVQLQQGSVLASSDIDAVKGALAEWLATTVAVGFELEDPKADKANDDRNPIGFQAPSHAPS